MFHAEKHGPVVVLKQLYNCLDVHHPCVPHKTAPLRQKRYMRQLQLVVQSLLHRATMNSFLLRQEGVSGMVASSLLDMKTLADNYVCVLAMWLQLLEAFNGCSRHKQYGDNSVSVVHDRPQCTFNEVAFEFAPDYVPHQNGYGSSSTSSSSASSLAEAEEDEVDQAQERLADLSV